MRGREGARRDRRPRRPFAVVNSACAGPPGGRTRRRQSDKASDFLSAKVGRSDPASSSAAGQGGTSFSLCRVVTQGHAALTRLRLADKGSRSRGRRRPSFALQVPPSPVRGRGECRVPNAPAASCALWGSDYAHEYSQRRLRKHPAFPTQWLYGFLRALPGDYRFVDPVAPLVPRLAARSGSARHQRTLTPTMGRQNHATSPSATMPLVLHALDHSRVASPCDLMRTRHHRVHRIPPHVS